MDKIEGDSLSKFVDFLNQHLSVIAPPRSITLTLSDICGDTRLFLYHSREDSQYALTKAVMTSSDMIAQPSWVRNRVESPEADCQFREQITTNNFKRAKRLPQRKGTAL